MRPAWRRVLGAGLGYLVLRDTLAFSALTAMIAFLFAVFFFEAPRGFSS